MDNAHFDLVTETYPPEINGVSLTVQSLELGLRELGHRVGLIRPKQAVERSMHSFDEFLVNSAPIPRYPGLRFGLPATNRLVARWKTDRPNAVYIATEGPLGWSAMRAARRLEIPVASGFHTRFDDYVGRYGASLLSPLVLAWLRRFHNDSDSTIVPTLELKKTLDKLGFRRVQVLARAVDLRVFHPGWRDAKLRAAWGLAEDDVAMIHVGRIALEKNLGLAERAFRKLQSDRPRTRFILVGDGPERSRMQARNPDFIFAGTLRGEALSRHFASADLFCFPSLSETFGNVTLESMASGLATVAFDYGAAHQHLRDGAHGALVPVADEAAFVEAIRRTGGEGALHAMGESARRSLSELGPLAVSRQFASLLTRLQHSSKAA